MVSMLQRILTVSRDKVWEVLCKIMCLTQANSYVTAATLIRSQIPISLGSLDTG